MFCCCVYLTDPFTVDNLATDYTIGSGSWSVSSGKLRTSSSGALILANPTSGSNYHTVTANVTMGTNGDSVNVLAGYLDASNHIFAQLTQTGGDVIAKLFKKVGGVDTQIGPTRHVFPAFGIGVFPGQVVSVQICCGPEVTSAYVGGAQRVESHTAPPPGPYVGFLTGTVSSLVTVDDLLLTRHKEDNDGCPGCGDCAACIKENGPAELLLEAPTDIIGGTCGSACANAHGTKVCSKFAGATPGQQGCIWFDPHAPGPCDAQGGWNVYAILPSAAAWDGGASPGTSRLRAVLGQLLPANVNIIYEKDYGNADPLDCLNFFDEVLPWVGEPGTVGCTSSTHAPVLVSTV